MDIAVSSPQRGNAFCLFAPAVRPWCAAPPLGLLGGCEGTPSRNILARLVFSVLDRVRAGGSCVGARRPRDFQGFRNSPGATRPLGRHARDRLCRHLCDVAAMAVLKNTYE